MRPDKRNSYQSDDENIRYKLNTNYINIGTIKPIKKEKKLNSTDDEDDVRYKFPTVLTKSKPVEQRKTKTKPKIKVNFWSSKTKPSARLSETQKANDLHKINASRRHTITTTSRDINKGKNTKVKVRKQVSFLPSPLFSDNHIPMVTVPDDLTIQLNEEEANDLRADLNEAFVNSNNELRAKSSMSQTSPRGGKRKRGTDESGPRIPENELEFFSKYVVQKLRRMETNQRIYSENLINTVLMLGQLGKLNGKSKIGDA